MKIDIHERRFDVSFETRLILSEMVMFSNPPTPLSEELLHSDPRIVQGAFNKLCAMLSAPAPAPVPVDHRMDDGAPNIMDQDPDTLRATAQRIEVLLQEIGIVTDSIEPYCDEGVSIDDVRKIAAAQVLPAENKGGLKLYGISGVNQSGARRILVCSGNSVRAFAIAQAAAMGFYLLPFFATLLRNQAATNEQMQARGSEQLVPDGSGADNG